MGNILNTHRRKNHWNPVASYAFLALTRDPKLLLLGSPSHAALKRSRRHTWNLIWLPPETCCGILLWVTGGFHDYRPKMRCGCPRTCCEDPGITLRQPQRTRHGNSFKRAAGTSGNELLGPIEHAAGALTGCCNGFEEEKLLKFTAGEGGDEKRIP